jgi:hypothetical protein
VVREHEIIDEGEIGCATRRTRGAALAGAPGAWRHRGRDVPAAFARPDQHEADGRDGDEGELAHAVPGQCGYR